MNKIIYERFLNGEISRSEALKLISMEEFEVEREEINLSEGQKGLWTLYNMDPYNVAYNTPGGVMLSENVDIEVLKKSLKYLVDFHHMLRAIIKNSDDGPYQVIEGNKLNVEEFDATNFDECDVDNKIWDKLNEPFDLEKGPLIKAYIYHIRDGKKFLILNFHHIVFDGMSSEIFMRDLKKVYYNFKDNKNPELKESKKTYTDFVKWEKDYLESAKAEIDLNYWLTLLHGGIHQLKIRYSGDIIYENNTKVCSIKLEHTLVDKLMELSKETHVSLFSTMMSAYMVLLSKYGNQNDISVGSPTFRRENKDFENLIGYFTNMMVVRCQVDKSKDINEFIQEVNKSIFESLDHSNYPYYRLVKEYNKQNKKQLLSLFQSSFYFQNYMKEDNDEIFTKRLNDYHQLGESDLVLEVITENHGLTARFKYNSSLYDQEIIQEMITNYKEMLNSFVDQGKQKIKINELFKGSKENAELIESNEIIEEFESFPELFKKQVIKQPKSIAAIFHNEKLTYEELYNESIKLAGYLKTKGVKKGELVGILLERSIDLLVSLIAVQMAGGAYIPLDPTYPKDRIEHMFTQSGMKFLISKKYLNGSIPDYDNEIINIDEDREKFKYINVRNEESVKLSREDLAYVIFTSGSTGKPKGIMVKHGGLSNFLISMRKEPGCTEKDYILALTTICFDIAGLEIYLPLISGAKVEILDEKTVKDGIELLDKFENSNATVMQATPATWQMLLAAGWNTHKNIKALCGGEALTEDLADKLINQCNEVWNMYGPTETTIWSSVCKLKAGENVSIGYPIDNTWFYILDEDLNEVPVGNSGELYIGGLGIAKGYINNEKETKKKFVKDINSRSNTDIMYRTGDLVKRNSKGNIEYIGRIDFQVKINGFRIELGEIEKVLENLMEIKRAIVVTKEDTKNSKYLVAFLIGEDEDNLPSNEYLKSSLKEKLSDYMIPAKYVFLKEYPLTLNKKVDRKKLSNEKISVLTTNYNDSNKEVVVEEQINDNKVLGSNYMDSISNFIKRCIHEIKMIDTNEIDDTVHLSEYGFDSISFTELSVKINEHFGIRINPTIFYTYQKVENFSNYLCNNFKKQIKEKMNKENLNVEEISKTKEKVNENNVPMSLKRNNGDDIAIIGMSGILPKAYDLKEFWNNLIRKRDCISEVPADRWDWKKFYNEADDSSNKISTKFGGFIDDVDKFDAKFFNISPREAEIMDPQQRLMLQVVWRLFENAGYKPSDFAESNTGVFVGATSNDYADIVFRDSNIESHSMTGIANNIIPNRVSYFFNLNGPSELIDTACSSALTSVCKAVNSIRCGESEVAIAGGVNLLATPFPYIALSKSNMLCRDGRCKTFDRSANGYVRSEGVAAILLKPLNKAIDDNDNIYAVIKGVAVNHGGRTNSLTAPNPNAEKKLIKTALKDANVDLSTLGYIETHGTGTALGDPIEINALNMVYEDGEHECEMPHCALGSVKTNIGHTEALSGLASLIKGVLSLYNKKIISNINFNNLNPYINLDNSPFYVADKNEEWKQLINNKGGKLPRRAGISSFGFGGSNAHIVLEEYTQKDASNELDNEKLIIILSAKYKEGLKRRVADLLDYLTEEDGGIYRSNKVNLKQIAYTLANGREQMKERIAIIVSNKDELVETLKDIVSDNWSKSSIVTSSKKIDGIFTDNNLIEEYLLKGQLIEIAQMWVNGVDIQWSDIYNRKDIRKVALPVYRFKKDRYWAGKRWNTYRYGIDKNTKPFIDEIIPEKSLLNGITFNKQLSNSDLILRDHVVNSKSIFPATGYIEMILEAVKTVKPDSKFKLVDILWKKGLVVENDDIVNINVELTCEEKDMSYEVNSLSNDVYSVHSKGKIVFEDNIEEIDEYISISDIKNRCSKDVSKDEFYTWLASESGIEYGEYFQGVQSINTSKDEAIAQIKLPNKFAHEEDEYYCHPVLMDCALQTMACLFGQSEEKGKIKIPFSVEEINILELLRDSEYYVYVKNVHKNIHNVFIVNKQGKVCVKFNNLISAQIKVENDNPFYVENWDKLDKSYTVNPSIKDENILIIYSQDSMKIKDTLVEIIGSSKITEVKLCNEPHINYHNNLCMKGDDVDRYIGLIEDNGIERIFFLSSIVNENIDVEDIAMLEDKQKVGVYGFFHLIKAVGIINKNVQVTVVTNNIFEVLSGQDIIPINAGLGTFVKTVVLEYSKSNVVLIDIDYEQSMSLDYIKKSVFAIIGCSQQIENKEVAIRGNKLYTRNFKNIAVNVIKETPYKDNGVYLIAGMGGISFELGKYISNKVRSNIIFIGRSELDDEKQAKLNIIKNLGANVEYIQTDLSNEDEINKAIKYIKNKYRKINGVFHSAIVLKDKMISHMTEEIFKDVNLAKVQGSISLFKSIKNEHLDFMILFSSINGVIGNIGQSNYCAACAFQDAFAKYAQSKVDFKIKVISWSYWGTIGVVATDEYREILKAKGLLSIDIQEGMRSIELTLKSPLSHIIMFKSTNGLLKKLGFDNINEISRPLLNLNNEVSASLVATVSKEIQIDDFSNSEDKISGRTKENKEYIESNIISTVDSLRLNDSNNIIERKENKVDSMPKNSYEKVDDELIKDKVSDYLKEKISVSLKMKKEDINNSDKFDSIGVDSMVIIELNKKLSSDFEKIPSTLFFEYSTIDDLGQYFVENYRNTCLKMFYNQKEIVENEVTEYISVNNILDQNQKKYSMEKIENDIAIIGVSGRYPLAENLDEYWINLRNGRNCIQEIPEDRWDWRKYYDPENRTQGRGYSKWGGFIKNVDKFDATFFDIDQEKANEMDPQERILLETTWSVLEDAGYPGEALSCRGDKVGVFIGTMYGYYGQIATDMWDKGVRTNAQSAYWIIPNRISHYFNFTGPSIAIDTACSSSLTAIHYACNSIKLNECNIAIAGGVNLILHPRQHVRLANLNSIGKSDKNYSFSKNADGYIEGEGVGVVVLKPLKDAIKDNDYIYGVIKGSAVNSGGNSSKFTAPSIAAQAEVIETTLKKADIDCKTVNYVEAHATGTVLGDPIEVSALSKVYKKYTDKKQFCPIGTIKSNIGHLEAASGISALTKVLLQMKHKKIVPSINCEEINEFIDFNDSPFYLVKDLTTWKSMKDENNNILPRRASISSFGAGGANAFIIVEEYLNNKKKLLDTQKERLIIFSAKTKESLIGYAESLIKFIENNRDEGLSLIDIAYTLQNFRSEMKERVAIVASTLEELLVSLNNICNNLDDNKIFRGTVQKNISTQIIDENVSINEIAELWVAGNKFNWNLLYKDEINSLSHIPLPTYCFDRRRYWINNHQDKSDKNNLIGGREVLYTDCYKYDEPYIRDHNSFSKRTLLGVTYCSMAYEGLNEKNKENCYVHLRNFLFIEPAEVKPSKSIMVQVDLIKLNGETSIEFKCMDKNKDEYKIVATGEIVDEVKPNIYKHDIPSFLSNNVVDGKTLYLLKPDVYRSSLQSIQKIIRLENIIWSQLSLDNELINDSHSYLVHPALLDAAILSRLALKEDNEPDSFVPMMIKELYIYRPLTINCYSKLEQVKLNSEIWEVNIDLFNDSGELAVSMRGAVCKKVWISREERKQEEMHVAVTSIDMQCNSNNAEISVVLKEYLIGEIAFILKEERKSIQTDKNIMSMGVDSLSLVSLAKNLEEKFKIKLFPTMFFEYQTIDELVNFLIEEHSNDLTYLISKKESNKDISKNDIENTNYTKDIEDLTVIGVNNETKTDDIAIIGVSAVMPQSDNLDDFWTSIKEGKCLITEIPEDRWNWRNYYKKNKQDKDKTNVIWGGFIKDADKFDSEFFGLSPREAKLMDPQQRISLELAWKAIEDAGYNPREISGSKTGVFIGVAGHDYDELVKKSNIDSYAQALTGNAHNVLVGRISYLLNLKGPSEPIDTACASSIVAIHRAIESISKNECEMAIAGGINMMFTPSLFIAFDNAGILSHDGKCKTFDKEANGTVRGEGGGLILLKPLSKAIKDKDNIYAVIKGCAVNHSGSSTSLTAPNPKQQSEVIIEAIKKSKVNPSTISYIEAHGTGTSLGDPIELNSLKSAFKEIYKEWKGLDFRQKTCAIGSVKTNIGHLETAAGIAGIIKIILAMKYNYLPKLVNFKNINPYIELEDSPFYLLKSSEEWRRIRNEDGTIEPYRAGISSFGFSGTNSHLILEEYLKNKDEKENDEDKDQEYIVCISARKKDILINYAKELSNYLSKNINTPSDNANKRLVTIEKIMKAISKLTNIPVEYMDRENSLEECGVNAELLDEFIIYINNIYSISMQKYLFNISNSLDEVTKIIGKYIEDNNEPIMQGDNKNKELLKKISYVFHNGRGVMKYRLAIISSDCIELKEKLDKYIEGEENQNGVYCEQNDIRFEKNNKYHEGALNWVNNGEIDDWENFYRMEKPVKISLPTYPFEKQRCWVSEKSIDLKGIEITDKAEIKESISDTSSDESYELIGTNISTDDKKMYKKVLNNNLFYLRDHIIEDKHILPGVIYLEMVRMAAEKEYKLQEVTQIKNIVWAQQMTVTKSQEAIIELLDDCDEVKYKVKNENEELYSKGTIKLGKRQECKKKPIDISGIRKRCDKHLTNIEFYKLFERVGFKYGLTFKSVEEIYFNENEAISKISISEELKSTIDKYLLHPSLLEGALQTAGYLANIKFPPTSATVPFEVESINIYNKLESTCYFYVTFSENNDNSNLNKMSGYLVNKSGKILLTINNYIIRKIEKDDNAFTEYLKPSWQEKAINGNYGKGSESIILFDIDDNLFNKLKELRCRVVLIKPGNSFRCISKDILEIRHNNEQDYRMLVEHLKDNHMYYKNIIHRWSARTVNHSDEISKVNEKLEYNVYSLFYLSKTILLNSIRDKKNLIYIYQNSDPLYEGIGGFIKSINLESRNIFGKTVGLERCSNLSNIILDEISCEDKDIEVRYIESKRLIKKMTSCNIKENYKNMIKEKGVYLITGGVGGIGLSIAKELTHKYDAKVVLCGRSNLQNDIIYKLSDFEDKKSHVIYVSGDIADIDDTLMIVNKTKECFGRIDGIIHCAGMVKDSLVIKKNLEDFKSVLAAKVLGTLNLNEATKNEKLDFIALFSSISGEVGNIGQSDYAYANSFMDYFAHYRSKLGEDKGYYGKVISIDWSLWDSGGIANNRATKIRIKNTLDLTPISNAQGMSILRSCLSTNEKQIFVLHGGERKMDTFFHEEGIRDKNNSRTDGEELLQSLIYDLTEMVSDISDINKENLSIVEDISNYGFDSVVTIEFAEKLSIKYNIEITPALFFELKTVSIKNLGGHLIKKFRDDLIKFYNNEEKKDDFISKIDKNVNQEEEIIKDSIKQIDEKELLKSLIYDLTEMVSCISDINKEKLSITEDISNYGFDSVVIIEFAEKLSMKYNIEVTPALFFEIKTISIKSLGDCLSKKFRNALIKFYYKENDIKEFSFEDEYNATSDYVDSVREEVDLIYDENKNPNNNLGSSDYTGIAIIGMSGVMPQSEDLDEFWHHIENGEMLITEVPSERWNFNDYYGDPLQENNKSLCKWGGFMKEIDKFDSSFFEISPKDANVLDPQQRIFLETAWKTIEDAGYKASSMAGSNTGVFVGITNNEYTDVLMGANLGTDGQSISANAHFLLANRVSYYFDFRGPSETVDTACSSSGVAIHRAINSINHGECEVALVGGVNTLISPLANTKFDIAGMLSRTGSCKAFSKDADGFVRGEGIGAILLKPLEKAIDDNDKIYAVIKGTAVNHNGRTKAFAAPNPIGEADVIKSAIQNSGVDPLTITYIEAQGTGSSMGDIIEVEALNNAFNELVDNSSKYYGTERCGIGSVKSNIGHLEAASAMASIFKVVLSMKHKIIPSSINCEQINPNIKLDKSEFYISREKREWNQLVDEYGRKIPRRAGINAFGAGGVNSHIILEEFEQEFPMASTHEIDKNSIIIFSAKSKESLYSVIEKTINFINNNTELNLRDVAYTLQVAREEMEERVAFIVKDKEDFQEKALTFLDKKKSSKSDRVLYGNIEDRNSEIFEIFEEDEVKKSILRKFMDNKQYYKIAKLWINGISINWGDLYAGEKRCRVTLPTYSFKKNRYWIDGTDTNNVVVKNIHEESAMNKQEYLYKENYQESKLDRDIKLELSKLLEMDVNEIKNNDSLSKLGFDSITAIKFKYKIEKKYSVTLSLANIGECKDIKMLVDTISNAIDLNSKSCVENSKSEFADLIEADVSDISNKEIDDLYEEIKRKITN
ncbi:amino acid adenylation domain-containing protein [Clostridium saccharoperbutylacetonicum]